MKKGRFAVLLSVPLPLKRLAVFVRRPSEAVAVCGPGPSSAEWPAAPPRDSIVTLKSSISPL